MSELPVLPEGYFWRVGPKEGYDRIDFINPHCFGVSLRRKSLIGSKVLYWSDPATPASIPAEAQEIFNEWQERTLRREQQSKLSGDYPPREWGIDG